MVRGHSNLPPGVTPRMIDEAMGAPTGHNCLDCDEPIMEHEDDMGKSFFPNRCPVCQRYEDGECPKCGEVLDQNQTCRSMDCIEERDLHER